MELYYRNVGLLGLLVFSVIAIWLMLRVQHLDERQPNIIIIQADDLGFDDVSFHGSDQIPTPNIDALAYNGVILNRFYTAPLCTPSRASLMTGKYPSTIGMQHFVILPQEPWGLSLKEKIMPQYFKDAGYTTRLIGKWHLGLYQEQYTPTRRGFDSHFGYLGAHIDYFNGTYIDPFTPNKIFGYDFRRNLSSVNEFKSKSSYVTNMFTDEAVNVIKDHDQTNPLFLLINHLAPHASNEGTNWEAPEEEIQKFSHIDDPNRRKLAAMISLLDKSVGEVVRTLYETKMLENTIIVFYSDNGAPTYGTLSTKGSNYPLRGQKQTPWEGASRTAGLVYSPLLRKRQKVVHDWIHVSDLLPTLLSAANIPLASNLNLDGIDQWSTISEGKRSSRREIEGALDNVLGYSGYIYDGWKIVNGTVGGFQIWGERQSASYVSKSEYANNVFQSEVGVILKKFHYSKKLKSVTGLRVNQMRQEAKVFCDVFGNANLNPCLPNVKPCLFELYRDPCELNNLDKKFPKKYIEMMDRFKKHLSKEIPSRRVLADPKFSFAQFNNTITWWQPDGPIN